MMTNAGVTRRTFTAALGSAALSVLWGQRLLAQATSDAGTATPPWRLDTHHHILPPEYVRLVGVRAIARPTTLGRVPEWDVAASLRTMDDNGVAAAIVSVGAPGVWARDARRARHLARVCNEFAAQMVAEHPHRFGFFAALPLQDVRGSLAELGYAVETLKCDGVGLLTNYGDRYLGDAGFAPIFDDINRCGLVVYVHPDVCGCDETVLPGVPSPMIEFPHSTTRTIVSLLSANAFARWPNIKFIFSHAGGTVPFLANRIIGQGITLGHQDWLEQLRRLYYDTAGSANAAAFGPLLRLVTSRQVVFGSDYPYVTAANVAVAVRGLRSVGLSDQELQDIETGNARALFPRFATPRLLPAP